jgi:cob(I)alamin adenosyltransferase
VIKIHTTEHQDYVVNKEAQYMVPDAAKGIGRGFVQVYTGNCKGKTTAALGLALRGLGHGLKTYMGQFMKGQHYGELEAVKMMQPYITIEQYGRSSWVHVQNPASEEDRLMAKQGLEKSREAMLSGEYDIIVLDEINTANYFKLISLEEMLELILAKPDGIELVFTGRHAPPELIMEADLVTEMTEVKHYFRKGIQARDGIER